MTVYDACYLELALRSDFRLTLASYGEMEATAGDPLSETVIRGRQANEGSQHGPVQTKIHDLLRS